MTNTPQQEMSPYLAAKYDSPGSSRPSTPSEADQQTAVAGKYASDDEISVGCPSPSPAAPGREPELPDREDYFGPLKRLKMVHQVVERRTAEEESRVDGVKSFSIVDILSHRPARPPPARIVRPWDIEPGADAASLERLHRHLRAQQQLAFQLASGASEAGSDRSSSVASDCCSPDLLPTARRRPQQPDLSTPLDALFQMTSKTFDSNGGETSSDSQNPLNLFNNRQQPKKKRKSRTAFTNHQIFELEKRFLYQKYLSPADRDEIASSLGLSNAQVITWFQNRRAKLKRDMEELKKDVESAKILTAHKSFLENVQDLGILKKKAVANPDDSPKSLVMTEK